MNNRESVTLSVEYVNRLNSISGQVLDAAIEVHRNLGPGLLESIYEICLLKELRSRGLEVKSQLLLPVYYKGEPLEKHYTIDLLVEDLVMVEIKTVERNIPINKAQLMTYLKLSGKHLGLLINFNVPLLVQGFERILNGQFPK